MTLYAIVSPEAGVASSLTFAPEISALKAASAAAPVYTVPYSVISAVEPS
jgi:hypothetical protein